MPTLTDDLAALARAARPYGDAAAAIRRADSRRRHRRVLASAVVSMMAVVAAMVFAPGRQVAQPDPAASGPPPVDRIYPYPNDPLPLATDAPDLPTDFAVGPAAFLRLVNAPGRQRVNVVLADGQQFQLPMAPMPNHAVSLSPDGNLVAWLTPQGWMMRDLSSTSQVQLPVGRVVQWSANSRWLLGWDTAHSHQVVVDMNGLGWHTLPADLDILGVLDSGALVTRGEDPGGQRVELRVIDPDSGETLRTITVDATQAITDDQDVVSSQPGTTVRAIHRLMICSGDLGVLWVDGDDYADAGGFTPMAMLTFSTVDGSRRNIIRLPSIEPIGTRWVIAGISSDPRDGTQILVEHHRQGYSALFAIDPVTGLPHEVSRLPYSDGPVELETIVRGGTFGWESQ